MTDPDHPDAQQHEYRLLSGELTRMTADGEPVKYVEDDVFRPTPAELDAFGDRLTRADDDSDASAHETGHGMTVTRRSYRIMSNYDGRNLRPQSRSRSRPSDPTAAKANAIADTEVNVGMERDRDLSDHPQSEDQQDLPEQPDIARERSMLGKLFDPPSRSPLSSGSAFRKAAEQDDDGVPLASDTDDAGTDTGLSVDEGVERIQTLARNYADNDYEMAHHEYEEALDDILSKMDVGDAVEALERVKVDQIRI